MLVSFACKLFVTRSRQLMFLRPSDVPETYVAFAGSPIFSIDVHPAGTRFVTAGSDHKAKVWNLLPVLEVRRLRIMMGGCHRSK